MTSLTHHKHIWLHSVDKNSLFSIFVVLLRITMQNRRNYAAPTFEINGHVMESSVQFSSQLNLFCCTTLM